MSDTVKGGCAMPADPRRPFVVRVERPDHLFGTTSGYRLTDPEVVRFTSRNATENALRRVLGSMAEAKRRGYKVVRDAG